MDPNFYLLKYMGLDVWCITTLWINKVGRRTDQIKSRFGKKKRKKGPNLGVTWQVFGLESD